MSQSAAPSNLKPTLLPIAVSTSGANVVVTGKAGTVIIVCQYNYMAAGTVNVKWESGTSPLTTIGGLAYLIINTGKVANYTPVGWFQTLPGEDLNINLSGNVAIGGEFGYWQVRVGTGF